ncbi:hypothetical protein ScPMuIL_018568 [Solemya velum]
MSFTTALESQKIHRQASLRVINTAAGTQAIHRQLALLPLIRVVFGKPETRYRSHRTKILESILWEEREYDDVSKRDYSLESTDDYEECCPVRMQRTAPLGGLSRDGTLLQLYRDSRTVQRLYETACLPSVLNRPCRFVNQSLFNSVCVQKYTYMYAIVKDYNITQPYRVDYIRVKSACSCQIIDSDNLDFEISYDSIPDDFLRHSLKGLGTSLCTQTPNFNNSLHLKTHMPQEPGVEEVIVDFESATWGEVRKALSSIHVHGCAFHWTQAVYCRMSEIGLQTAYRDHEETERVDELHK